jgi:hypothetical protein
MEDKHIFKGEKCYSFRVDVSHNDINEGIIIAKLKEYFTRACLAREHKKCGMPHYQSILWREQPLGKNASQTIRTFMKQKFGIKHKNFMSLTSARNVRSLAKYCNDKEEKGVISFGISDLSVLGKWENPEKKKDVYRDKLILKLKSMKQSSLISMRDLCKAAIDIYVDIRPPPFKSLLVIGRSAGYIPDDVFISEYYHDLQFAGVYVRDEPNNWIPKKEQQTMQNYLVESESESDMY